MADKNEILEVAKTTINASIKCNTIRGYIGWHNCDNICMDMYNVLDMCREHFKAGDYMDVLETAVYLLVSGVKLASRADSSSGMLTDVITYTFEQIDLCTRNIAMQDTEMKKKALSLIIRESKKNAFDGWTSWRYELLEKAICCCDEKMATKLEKLLDAFLQNSNDEYMADYDKKEIAVLRYKLHRHLKGVEEVRNELYANLHIRELRLIAVQDAMEEKNYSEAERLCREKIEKEGRWLYRNSSDDWNNILYDVYVKAGNVEKQIEQAKSILLLGNQEFWDVLKKLYSDEGVWEDEKPLLLEELKNSRYMICYRSILIKEDEKKLLLEAVKEQPFDLFYYGQFLVKEYPEEIYALCENDIREKCAEATNRRLYKKICKDLAQLIKWNGDATAKRLVEEFKTKYPRRTALLDELEKVNGFFRDD